MPSHSFRNRLIAIFLVLAIVPLLLTAVLVGYQSYRTHLGETRERQVQRADSVAAQLVALLHEADEEIRLAVRMTAGVNDTAMVQHAMERLLADRRSYREILLLDANGVVVRHLSNIRISPPPPPEPRLSPEVLKRLAANQSQVEQLRFDAATGEPFVALSVPVMSPRTGRLVAVVLVELRARDVWELVGEQKLINGESVYVIDESGYVVAHANPSLVLGGRRASFESGRAWQTGLQGEAVLAVGADVDFGARRFTVVVERTLVAAISPAVHAVALIGMVTIFTIGVASGLLVLAVRSIVRPLQTITMAAVAVRDGDYDRQVDIDSRDEIGQLADSFNSMTARLRKVMTELHSEVVERRSAEAQLLKVNKAYQALSAATALLDRLDDERHILDEVCRIVVDDCGYRLAWIGLLESDGRDRQILSPVAHAGLDEGYLEQLRIDLGDPERSRGPAARALVLHKPAVVRDVMTDLSFAPWREEAVKRGFGAVAAIPLQADGNVLGTLTVYAGQTGTMSEEELRLLGELASNLAQGLTALRLRQDRSRAERELRESEARLRNVTNAIPALVWMLDKENGVTYVNQRYYEYTGLREGEALRDGWQRCVHPDDLPKVQEHWRDVLAAGDRYEGENRLRRADGSYRWFLVQGEPIVSEGGRRVWFGTCIDIEDRKRSELQLIQASKLATLGEMAASMAHELGQPLNIIRIVSDDALAQGADGPLSVETETKSFHTIADQAARMGQIIEHMRVFSRDDNLQQEVFDVAAVLRSAADLMGAQLAAHGIALRQDLPERPLPILGNRTQLEQVIFNLIANARDAIEGQAAGPLGSVRGCIGLAAAVRGTMVVVSVADDGPGIPAGALPHIFEPFFTTKPAGKGTGLGLAISQRIVQRMGGWMEAHNPGQGAEFRLVLPLSGTRAEPQAAAAAPKPIPAATGGRLLIVDDERMAADLLQEILARRGYDVQVAHDAGEAVELFHCHTPHLVITDITMPGGDGASLVARMRKDKPDLPVIFITGRLDAASLLADELRGGRSRLFRKPVAIDQLVPMIAELLVPAETAEA